jgi:hypothetical protein
VEAEAGVVALAVVALGFAHYIPFQSPRRSS